MQTAANSAHKNRNQYYMHTYTVYINVTSKQMRDQTIVCTRATSLLVYPLYFSRSVSVSLCPCLCLEGMGLGAEKSQHWSLWKKKTISRPPSPAGIFGLRAPRAGALFPNNEHCCLDDAIRSTSRRARPNPCEWPNVHTV